MENVLVAAIPDQKCTGAAIEPKLSVTYNGKKLVEGDDFAVEYKNNTAAGKASAVLSGVNPFLRWHFDPATHAVEFIPSGQDRFFDGAKTVTFNIVKEPQPMKATASSKTLKAKNLKKKAVTYAPIKVVNAKGKVTYQVVGGNAKSKKALKLNTGNGKVTVQKKTKKGSYMIQVKVTAAGTSTGNPQYAAGSQTVKVAVKVK